MELPIFICSATILVLVLVIKLVDCDQSDSKADDKLIFVNIVS